MKNRQSIPFFMLLLPQLQATAKYQFSLSHQNVQDQSDPGPPAGPTTRSLIFTVHSWKNNLVPADDLRALVLDPTEPIPQRSLDLTFNRVNLVLGDPLLPLHLRVVEAPRLRRGLTRPSHSLRNRCRTGRARPSRVVLVGPKPLSTHNNLEPPVTPTVPMPRPEPIHFG